MIKLVALPTPNSHRVSLMLTLSGLKHSVRLLQFGDSWIGSKEHLAIDPTGLLPVIIDDEKQLSLAQSGEILIYLAEVSGKFLPLCDRERVSAMQWFMHVMTDINASHTAVFLARNRIDHPHEETIGFFEKRLLRYFASCDRELVDRPFLAGAFSIADIALFPLVRPLIDSLLVPNEFHNLIRWATDIAAMPGTTAGMEFGQ